MTLARRIERVERLTPDAQSPAVMRVVISACGRRLNLAGSTCDRMLGANGSITEIVRLDGSRGDITDQELDRFVAGFPLSGSPVCGKDTKGHARRQIGAEKSRW
jgi:hypothetical protein